MPEENRFKTKPRNRLLQNFDWSLNFVLTLPMQILELLKPADKRSPKVIALLSKFGVDGGAPMKELSIMKAENNPDKRFDGLFGEPRVKKERA